VLPVVFERLLYGVMLKMVLHCVTRVVSGQKEFKVVVSVNIDETSVKMD